MKHTTNKVVMIGTPSPSQRQVLDYLEKEGWEVMYKELDGCVDGLVVDQFVFDEFSRTMFVKEFESIRCYGEVQPAKNVPHGPQKFRKGKAKRW
jgi:hypothetical protein